jgi:uncharacterized protein (TIGR00725 family)
MARKPLIAIVGSGDETEPAVANARELGRLIAENGWALVTGGRNAGVMRAANEGAKQAKESLTVGILPNGNTEIAAGVDIAIVTDTGEARNNVIVRSADVVIACGVDDPGTASEVALALKAERPVILLNASREAAAFFTRIGGSKISGVELVERAIHIVSTCLAVKRDEKW